MKKKVLTVALTALLPALVYAQTETEKKRSTVTNYSVIFQFDALNDHIQTTHQRVYSREKGLLKVVSVTFNKSGCPEQIFFSENKEGSYLLSRQFLTRNKDGVFYTITEGADAFEPDFKDEVKSFRVDNDCNISDDYINKVRYFYENGKLARIIAPDNKFSSVFEYDNRGDIVRQKMRYGGDTFLTDVKYEYDGNRQTQASYQTTKNNQFYARIEQTCSDFDKEDNPRTCDVVTTSQDGVAEKVKLDFDNEYYR